MKRAIKKNALSIIAILLFGFSLMFCFALFSSADDSVTAREESSENSDAEIATLTKNYRPKMSITLDSNFVVNVYIPAKST